MIIYNLPDAPPLATYPPAIINREACVGIFNGNFPIFESNVFQISKKSNFPELTLPSGTISHWNDPVLVNSQDIPEWRDYLQRTNQPISVWVRGDSSGVTELLSSALSKFNPQWTEAYGSFDTWPDFFSYGNSTHKRAEGSSGVLAGVGITPYTIGYSGLTSAWANGFQSLARVENRAGNV